MTDRELLEKAARAVGMVFSIEPQNSDYGRSDWGDDVPHANGEPWNPLTDDGDALPLAVNLGISVKFSGNRYSVSKRNVFDICCEWEGPDRCSLIRRMIVTEAAAMADQP